MLDVNRIRHMTHMAMLDKHGLRDCVRMQKYTRKDYVSLRMMLGFVAGSILYALVFLFIATIVITFVVGNLTYTVIVTTTIVGVVGYLLYTYFHLRLVHRRAIRRYATGMREITEARKNLEILEKMYQEQESVPEDVKE